MRRSRASPRCLWSTSSRTPTRRARATPSAGRTSRSCSTPGIDVYTTLNVQHLESLNDVVGRSPASACARPCPTASSTQADEVELVDLPPDELLERLREGKVYLPGAGASARSSNFFRKGNLIALRELALRRPPTASTRRCATTATSQGIRATWAAARADPGLRSAPARLGASSSCAPARRMAHGLRADGSRVYVETPRLQRLPEAERDAHLAHCASPSSSAPRPSTLRRRVGRRGPRDTRASSNVTQDRRSASRSRPLWRDLRSSGLRFTAS